MCGQKYWNIFEIENMSLCVIALAFSVKREHVWSIIINSWTVVKIGCFETHIKLSFDDLFHFVKVSIHSNRYTDPIDSKWVIERTYSSIGHSNNEEH